LMSLSFHRGARFNLDEEWLSCQMRQWRNTLIPLHWSILQETHWVHKRSDKTRISIMSKHNRQARIERWSRDIISRMKEKMPKRLKKRNTRGRDFLFSQIDCPVEESTCASHNMWHFFSFIHS
jgi:hypothetical protein